ncbi:hypothetical protein BJ322DRAFT_1070473 [Thelephora terrestris]|uniref:BTB domain-containing protein n=1 Tax=Thelephora terrestris TaxID=56493 RepID=A0A9P6HB51_9AGAM|nr:hypothetical protein BJ322DRAFT_1070473 [Thelephora terrestris]
MPTSTFFTTDDGDIILRAGSESGTKHDFRVHKLILSLASPVFKDMLTFPQPPDQTSSDQHQLPVVDVPEPPEVLNDILRFIYPGEELPKILERSTINALLVAADKYNISSIYPTLRANLKNSLSPRRCDTFSAYVIACRFGFPEIAKEAAGLSSTQSLIHHKNHEDVQYISSTDLLRLVEFVLTREYQGLHRIQAILDQPHLLDSSTCRHGETAQDYYFHLEKEVEKAFVGIPCVGFKDLFEVLDRITDPPIGCDPPPESADWHYESDDQDAFCCPLRPMTIRRRLTEIEEDLRELNRKLLDSFFGKGSGGG